MDTNGEMQASIAVSLTENTDYIAATMPSVNLVMDGYYQQFRKDTSAYFENVLHNLQSVHQDSFDRREQELYRQIAELQGQVLDLQEQLTTMIEKCNNQQANLDKQKENSVNRQLKKYKAHTSPWALKKVFLAWKALSIRSKQRVKTEKFLDHWEKKAYSFKVFALWNHVHSALKYDHSLTDNKFKYETLSNEMVAHYENEQSKLQNDLNDAYALVKKEEQKRLQLEESMRKMFLKNMTTMNMEALNIFQSINKFDPTDILNGNHAFQQQQQAALNAAMAEAHLSGHGNDSLFSNPVASSKSVPINDGASMTTTMDNVAKDNEIAMMSAELSNNDALNNDNNNNSSYSNGEALYLAQLAPSNIPMVPQNNSLSTQGMFSPAGPPATAMASYPYFTAPSYSQNQQLPPQTMMSTMYQNIHSNLPQQPPITPSVRFDVSNGVSQAGNVSSNASLISSHSTPHKLPAPLDTSSIQDREYLDRLTEQYRQNISISARFAQNAPMPQQPYPSSTLATPIHPPQKLGNTASSTISPHQASNSFSMYPSTSNSTVSSGLSNTNFLSGYNIRRK